MLLLRKVFISIIALLLASGCGFEPLYADKEGGAFQQLQQIEIGSSRTARNEQLLTAELEDRFYGGVYLPKHQQNYTLRIKVDTDSLPILIEPDGKALRHRIVLKTPYTLTRKSDKKLLQHGTIKQIVSYNVSDDDYATFVAKENAVKIGLIEIAEKFSQRFGAYFSAKRQ